MLNYIAGDLFELGNDIPGSIICIPTNGMVQKDKRLIMGGGVALTAKQTYKDIDLLFGEEVIKNGSKVSFVFCPWSEYADFNLVCSFPTKTVVYEDSKLWLIKESCEELLKLYKLWKEKFPNTISHIFMPLIGCGLGNLKWPDVELILEEVFFDFEKRFGTSIFIVLVD